MLIKRSFVYAEDQDTHKLGWRPAKISEFNAGSGYHVAHDTLEHFEDTNVGFTAEMRAFGATMYLRAEGYYWQQDGVYEHVSQILRNDFVGFMAQSGSTLTDPGDAPTTTPYVEDIIQGLIHWATYARDKHRADFPPKYQFATLLKYAAGWIRKGYHESAVKYAGIPQTALSKLFKDVMDTVNAVDTSDMHYDDKLTVTVNTDKLTVTTKVTHDGKRAGKPLAVEPEPERGGDDNPFAEFIRAISGDADARNALERVFG